MDNEDKIIFSYSVASGAAKDIGKKVRYFQALDDIKRQLANQSMGGANANGFIFEALVASDKNIKGISDGSIAKWLKEEAKIKRGPDIVIIEADGTEKLMQAKMGYSGTNKHKVRVSDYKGQRFVADKGNRELITHIKRQGGIVEESSISQNQTNLVTNVMKKETQLTGNKTAPITSQLLGIGNQLKAANQFGLSAMKGTAAFSAGFSFGNNMYEFIEGNIELQDLLLEAAKDTIPPAVYSYFSGVAGYLVAGTLAETAVGVAASQATAVIVGTSVGQTIVTVGSTVVTMSAAMGPAFILGMAVGTGYATIKILKYITQKDKQKLTEINHVFNEALESMEQAQRELKLLIDETFTIWDKKFESGFNQIYSSTRSNNVEGIAQGLDLIVSVFGESVKFKSHKEFDNFFMDEKAVFSF